jgi:hypothetical protein
MNKLPTNEEYEAMLDKVRATEQITAAHWCNGKLYIFTPQNTYVARRYRWYDKLWDKLRAGWKEYERYLKGGRP